MENIPKDLQNIIYDYVRQLKISNINDNIKDCLTKSKNNIVAIHVINYPS